MIRILGSLEPKRSKFQSKDKNYKRDDAIIPVRTKEKMQLKLVFSHKRRYLVVAICLMVLVVAAFPQSNGADYRTPNHMIENRYDVSLNWSHLVGSKEWTTFTLWDDGVFSHFNVSFKFNSKLAVKIPASLQTKYAQIVEPGERFDLEAVLSLSGNREVTLSTEFFIKLDLDLPLPVWIPSLGFTDKVNNVFGGSWDFKLNLNTENVNEVMNKIFMGKDNENLQSFSSYMGFGDLVTIEKMSVNTQTLGKLTSATIRVSFLKAILAAAKTLTSLTPPFSLMVDTLKWLLDNVIKVDTGLEITPSLNAEVISGISSDPELVFDADIVIYDQDISAKKATASVSRSSKETGSNNEINFRLDPLEYAISFASDWTYYFDVDIDFLSLDVYHNSWSWNLGTTRTPLTKASSATERIICNTKLDDPVHVTSIQESNGEISIGASDNSGISNVEVAYSTDTKSWSKIRMTTQGDLYKVTPINSVEQDTTVYYYLAVTDGDNDTYVIDNNGTYYSYLMEPNNSNSNWISDLADRSLMLILAAVTVFLVIIVTTILFLRKKRRVVPSNRFAGSDRLFIFSSVAFIKLT